MKLQLDVEVKTNAKGELEVVSQGISKVGNDAEKANFKLSDLAGGLKSLAGPLAALGTGAGLVALAKSAIDLGDELETMHERTGIAVETLSILKTVAETSGSSLDSVALGMRKASIAAYQAIAGNKDLALAMHKAGLEVKDLKRMAPEEIFEKAAKGLAKIPSQTERNAVAFQIFGRNAQELQPILDELANKGMKGLGDEAAAAGTIMSGEAAKAADTFKDRVTIMSTSAKIAIVDVANAANTLTDSFTKDLPKGFQAIANPIQIVTNIFKGLISILLLVVGTVKTVGSTLGNVADFTVEALRKIAKGDFSGIADAWKFQLASIREDTRKIESDTTSQILGLKTRWGNQGASGPGTSKISPDVVVPTGPDPAALEAQRKAEAALEAQRKESLRLFEEQAKKTDEIAKKDEERVATSADLIEKSKAQVESLKAQQEITAAIDEKEKARLILKQRLLEASQKEAAAVRATEAELEKGNITAEAADSAEWAAFQQRLTDQQSAFTDYQTTLTGIEEDENRKRVESWREATEKISGVWKQGISGMLQTLTHGGDFKSALQGFIDTFASQWADSLSGLINGFVDSLASISRGEVPKEGPFSGMGSVSPGQQKAAKWGGVAIQAGAALYGMYTNPAPTRGQNVLSGAAMGAGIGTEINPGWGTVIGAVIGAIVGAFMPTEKGKSIKIVHGPGGFSITGLDSGEWGQGKALRQIQSAFSETASIMDDILTGIPAGILDQLSMIRPDLSHLDFEGKADGKNWTEELENFIRFTVPNMVMKAYEPIFEEVFTLAGVHDDKIKQIESKLDSLDASKAQEWLRQYIKVLFGIEQQIDFLNKSMPDRMTFAVGEVNKTPLDQMKTIQDQIGRLAGGFGDLDLDQQQSRAQQILDLVGQRYEMELQYLAQIKTVSEAISKSIEQQIFDIAQTQRTPKEQIDALLGKQRDLFDELRQAKTPEEVARITQEIQQNANQLFELMGKTPEAARQITEMLRGANEVAQQRLDQMAAQVEEADKLLKEVLDAILAFLQGLNNIDQTQPAQPNNPNEGGPGGGPQQPGQQPGSNDANANLVYINPPDITVPVTVVLNGSTAAIVTEVSATVEGQVTSNVLRTIARQRIKELAF